MIPLHGSTRRRALEIIRSGPDPWFCEPGGSPSEMGFSMCLAAGPFKFGSPEDYARGKAKEFPDEGGRVILVLDVPMEIILKAVNDWFPLSQGLIQFDLGAGLDELIKAWPEIAASAEIRSVT